MTAHAETLAEPHALMQRPSMALVPPTSDSQALMQMIATAMTRADFDVDKLQKLLAVKKEWEADEARKAYNRAFAAFKAEAVRILKNCAVKDGPLKGKGYAELHAVVDAVTPALSKHELSASWKLTKDERDWIEVTCTLKHNDGHAESVSMGGPPDTGGAKNAIQARASTISYLERYTLKAITGVAEGGEDDDGAGGAEGGKKTDAKTYPADQFDRNLPAWRKAIGAGQKTADDLIKMVETKAPLTDQQKARIRGQQ